MTIRTIVIDDSPVWRDILTRFVKSNPVLKLIGEYASALDAYSTIAKNEVDFILTDIEMPDLDGMKFIKNLQRPPLVVFATSHPQFALQGFEASAVDYLLKPFEVERFLQCVERVRLRFEANNALKADAPANDDDNEYFFIKVNQDAIKLRYNDVLYMQSMENYVQVHTVDGKVHTTISGLASFEKDLPSTVFMRSHRSYLFNYRLLANISKDTLTLHGGEEIPTSSTYFDKIQRSFVNKKTIRR
jgi:two-component system, LytTR family, response regulator